MLDHAHDAIIVHDFHDRKISFWNRGAESLYHWTSGEAIGRDIGELIFDDASKLDSANQHLARTGEWHGENQHLSKDGKSLIVSTRASLVRDLEGLPKSVLVINTDITDQKKMEAQFLRAQRVESIGTLASGVAHDLNNIIAPILMCAPLLREEVTAADREHLVHLIVGSAQRGANIVKQVLTFAHGGIAA